MRAPIAQRIEHRSSEPRVGGSNPSGRASLSAAMDRDFKTAKPRKKKLLELGLEDVAQELWP
jgi:hypothetical protein